ncbi:MAG TPA: 2-C-methyl-D-erythritol 2,4-cyclodiphosphate synthase, partial [Burkholderiales bacterium]|nr:2-C-methyl-D-erythritol 2,4-cyclodiphosphate synthase [Burkholderiales bacterium]
KVGTLVRDAGYRIVNIDSTIIAQKPKMMSHIPLMIERIASDLEMNGRDVNVKAKTTEHLGFAGRGEGIAAEAVALIESLA